MKIKVTKADNKYNATCPDIPTFPGVGVGDTKDLAVSDLFRKILKPDYKISWASMIDWNDKPEIIDE